MFALHSRLIVLSVLLVLVSPAFATEATPKAAATPVVESNIDLYIRANYHFESRSGVSKSNPDFNLGVDFRLGDSSFYAGPRAGVVLEKLLTFSPDTSVKPFLGGHIFYLREMGGIQWRSGLAVDILAGDSSDPLYMYVGVEGAPRFNLSDKTFLEVPFEIGMFPFFSGIPIFFRGGLAIGFRL